MSNLIRSTSDTVDRNSGTGSFALGRSLEGSNYFQSVLLQSVLEKKEQAMIEWNNLNFFVPASKPRAEVVKTDTLLGKDSTRQSTIGGLPKQKIINKRNKYYKQILFESTGYVKPKEMVAIMGPSGSGKTSLLNALSQRLGLNAGAFTEGQIMLNGQEATKGDYGKVGAFV